MASWKSRNLTPNATTLQKIADYFRVPVDYLLGKDVDTDTYTELVCSGKVLGDSLYKLYIAERSGESHEKNEQRRRLCLEITENMWGHVAGGIYVAQSKYGISTSSALIRMFNKLNDETQQRIIGYMEALAEIPSHRRQDSPEPPVAPSCNEDPTPPPEGTEEPPGGE